MGCSPVLIGPKIPGRVTATALRLSIDPSDVANPMRLSFTTLAALYGVTLTAVALGESSPVNTIVGISFLINLVVVPFVMAIHVAQGRVTSALVHLLGIWLMLCIAPFTAFLNGRFASYDFFNLAFSDELIVTANALILLWVVCFHVSYLTVHRKVSGSARSSRISAYGIWLQIVFAFWSLTYIYETVGLGVLTRKGFEEAVTGDTTAEIVLLFGPVRMASIFALVAGTWYLVRAKGRPYVRLVMSAVLLMLAIGTAAINNPIAAPRYFIGSVGIGFTFLIWLRNGKRAIHFVVLMLAAVLLLFPIDLGRYSANLLDALSDIVFSPGSGFRQDNFRTYETIIAALYFVGKWGSVYGMQLLGNILFFVPRSVWESKPLGTGAFLAQTFGESFTNISCPLQCEALVNFGVIGVPVSAIAFGWLLQRLDGWYWRQRPLSNGGVTAPLLIYPFLLGSVFFLTRGDLLSPLAYSVTMALGAVPLFLGTIFERWLKRGIGIDHRFV